MPNSYSREKPEKPESEHKPFFYNRKMPSAKDALSPSEEIDVNYITERNP